MQTFAFRLVLTLAAGLLAPLAAHAQARLEANPAVPRHGQPVELRIANVNAHLPSARFSRSGSTITLEADHLPSTFGPFSRNVGEPVLLVGELPPGNYQVLARLTDLSGATGTTTVSTTLAVVPPDAWGAYMLPAQPPAFSATHAVLRSAAYLDPSSLRTSVAGPVVRVDFEYLADAPASGPAPAGMQAYGSVPVPALAPGSYRLEAWGTPKAGGAAEKYFERDFVVGSAVPVVEYYSALLDHFFVAAGADEIALLDRGGQGDWKRTGFAFKAWFRAGDAPPGAAPVCRFYARGPNSHFYTGSESECRDLRAYEDAQRAAGGDFPGWSYEGTAFWTVMPVNGACPAGLAPVYRLYNGRAAEMDSNHRFTSDAPQRAATSQEWVDEGVHLCAPA